MNAKVNKSLLLAAIALASTDELRATAKKLGVPVGKSKSNTVANLAGAVESQKARFTLTVTVRSNENPDAHFYHEYSNRNRNHRTSQNRPNRIPIPCPPFSPARSPGSV